MDQEVFSFVLLGMCLLLFFGGLILLIHGTLGMLRSWAPQKASRSQTPESPGARLADGKTVEEVPPVRRVA